MIRWMKTEKCIEMNRTLLEENIHKYDGKTTYCI